LFMNRKFKKNVSDGALPRIIDLAPTILNYLGAAVPESMEGTTLL
jgi:bisphosphoglycerate-independent phosphoglycerate mutase (AlkP superfamily)